MKQLQANPLPQDYATYILDVLKPFDEAVTLRWAAVSSFGSLCLESEVRVSFLSSQQATRRGDCDAASNRMSRSFSRCDSYRGGESSRADRLCMQ